MWAEKNKDRIILEPSGMRFNETDIKNMSEEDKRRILAMAKLIADSDKKKKKKTRKKKKKALKHTKDI